MIPTSASLTFKAEVFQNICVIQLLTYHYDDAGDYPVKCTIVDAKGRGIMGVSDLTTGLTPTINTTKRTSQDDQADIYTFNFGNDTELSEVTLRFSADLYIDKASVSLNVDPVVSDQDLTLYADDTVPFEKKTNLSSVYQCYVSNNKDLEDDDLEDRFRDIPAAGITLAGKADGQYAFYLRTNPDITTNHQIHRMIVNYSATPPSTEIEPKITSSAIEYYNLNGRRIKTLTRGLNIIKNTATGQTSKVLVNNTGR